MKAKEIRASRMKYIDVMDKVKPVKFLPKLDVITIAGAAEYLETEPTFISSYYAGHLKELQEYGATKLFANDFLNAGYTKDSQRAGSCDVLRYEYTEGRFSEGTEVRVSGQGARCLTKSALFYMILGMNCSEVVERIKSAVIEAESADANSESVTESEGTEEVSTATASSIQTFTNTDFGSVRVVDVNGEPWFVAADVCKALEIEKTDRALSRLDDDEKGAHSVSTLGGKQKVAIVNEPGLYSLVLGSRKPEAKAFKRWISHEVIPSIRKHGAYMTPEKLREVILSPDVMIEVCMNLKAEQEKNKQLTAVNKALADEISTWDNRSILNALVRKISSKCFGGNFQLGWNYFYKQYNYKYHRDVKKCKDTSKSLIDRLTESQLADAVRVAASICEVKKINTGEIINEVNAARVDS